MDTVLTNVSAAQTGNLDSIDLMLMDNTLVYEVFISAIDGDYLAIVDAATANVLSVTLDNGEDDYEGDDGEGDDGENDDGEDEGEDTAED